MYSKNSIILIDFSFIQNFFGGHFVQWIYVLSFYKNNFKITKALILTKHLRTSQEQSHDVKNEVSWLAILKIKKKTSEKCLAVTYIALHVD